MARSEAADGNAEATLADWRAQGQDGLDPVRFHFIEALVRRAQGHQGEARRLLDARAAGLLAAYGRDLEAQALAASAEDAGLSPAPASCGPLAELVAAIAHRPRSTASSLGSGAAGGADAPELEALGYFRTTWSRLSAERRLTQALAQVPENAGPLNSQQLVHRALRLMRELSPAYLQRFMAHVDALLWLDQVQGASVPATPEGARAERPRKGKGSRGKAA